MPAYTFHCIKCNTDFEIHCSYSEYNGKALCPKHRKHKTYRKYDIDLPITTVKLAYSEIKTVGHLAERNTEIMSNDQKEEMHIKHNAYKKNKIMDWELPKGMTNIKRPDPVEWT